MSLKQAAQNLGFRVLRLIGGLLLIYVSIVFYLALTERQNAYPRAITHKEAQAAIKATSKPLTCTLDDGIALEGWSIGDAQSPVFLYYPDANEDAAQFLAEANTIEGITLVTFNYRGSGNNKGTPSAETFSADARGIAECAAQANGSRPEFFSGRGTGAILAANNADKGGKIILIDPVWSIADALTFKYRKLYPKLIIRAKESMDYDKMAKTIDQVRIMLDRMQFESRSQKVLGNLPGATVQKRGGASFRDAFQEIVNGL